MLNNITFQALQKSKARLEACLEVDKGMDRYQRASIVEIIDLLDRMINEATKATHAA